jgi:alpha-1,2-mannosyltransferase
LTRRRLFVYPKLFAAIYASSAVIWILRSHGLVDPAGHTIGADFAVLWSASRLALNGTAASVYDIARLWPAEKATAASSSLGYTSFSYPPMYLVIVLPLAMLPYVWSLFAWTAATFAAYCGVMGKIDPEWDSRWLAIAFPGAMVNLTNGQNGFLTLAFLGGALLSLERRPILAGVLFGLMCYKPQYGVLVPIFLLTTGRWRVFAGASLTVVSFAAVSLAMFGEKTWRAFFGSIVFTRNIVIEQGGSGFNKMQSAFGAARLWGLSVATAYAFQIAVCLIVTLAVIWIWRRTAKFELQAAALATGVLLMTPYMMDYDLVILALPIAWIALEGRRSGFLPWEKSLLVLLWLLPLFARSLAGHALIPVAPLAMLLLLADIASRALVPSAIVPLPSREGVRVS